MTTPPERYLKCINTKEDDWTSCWFDEIGWLGYFFAQLEWCTFWLAELIGSDEQRSVICKRLFADRCKYAKNNLVPQLKEASLRDEWSALLDEIAKTGTMRNEILHNPLNVNVKEIESHGVKIDQGIRLLREKGGKVIELGEVQEFTKRIRDLNGRMIDLMERTAPTAKTQSVADCK